MNAIGRGKQRLKSGNFPSMLLLGTGGSISGTSSYRGRNRKEVKRGGGMGPLLALQRKARVHKANK